MIAIVCEHICRRFPRVLIVKLCSCFLFTSQYTLVHHLRIFVATLIIVEDTLVVYGFERGCVLCSPCLLFTSKCTLVHHLRIFKATLNNIKNTQVVDGVERGCVLCSACLLFTSKSTIVHHLCIFVTD